MKIEVFTEGCGALNGVLKFSMENGVSLKGFEQRDRWMRCGCERKGGQDWGLTLEGHLLVRGWVGFGAGWV